MTETKADTTPEQLLERALRMLADMDAERRATFDEWLLSADTQTLLLAARLRMAAFQYKLDFQGGRVLSSDHELFVRATCGARAVKPTTAANLAKMVKAIGDHKVTGPSVLRKAYPRTHQKLLAAYATHQDAIRWDTPTGAPVLEPEDWALTPPSPKLRRALVLSHMFHTWNNRKPAAAQLKTLQAKAVLPLRVLARAADGKSWVSLPDGKEVVAELPAWVRVGNHHFQHIQTHAQVSTAPCTAPNALYYALVHDASAPEPFRQQGYVGLAAKGVVARWWTSGSHHQAAAAAVVRACWESTSESQFASAAQHHQLVDCAVAAAHIAGDGDTSDSVLVFFLAAYDTPLLMAAAELELRQSPLLNLRDSRFGLNMS